MRARGTHEQACADSAELVERTAKQRGTSCERTAHAVASGALLAIIAGITQRLTLQGSFTHIPREARKLSYTLRALRSEARASRRSTCERTELARGASCREQGASLRATPRPELTCKSPRTQRSQTKRA